MLFNLDQDPDELNNLADQATHQDTARAFHQEVAKRWDIPALHAQVLASQRRRRLVGKALAKGKLTSWDRQPHVDASQQFMRNHIDLDDLERRARFPVVT
jgi:choline-sulfatase